MPMSIDFQSRLFPHLSKIVDHYGTPFHIYDVRGLLENGTDLTRKFMGQFQFKEFFAVKANPNPEVLKLMRGMGFGFDCSSIPELVLATLVGAKPGDVMFTSNNTSTAEFQAALDIGCIFNLDDITMIENVPEPFPRLICFRYNPGERRSETSFIGVPCEAKYGVRHDQLINAYRMAMARGANRFGLHTMIASNTLDCSYMIETVRMLLEVVEEVSAELGIKFKFINMGGGIGIPYHPNDAPFDLFQLAHEARYLLHRFK